MLDKEFKEKVNNFVCENHSDILDLCNKIKEEFSYKFVDKYVILDCIEIIEDRVKQANYQANKMEDRMIKYRKSIEKLGFVRVDKDGL